MPKSLLRKLLESLEQDESYVHTIAERVERDVQLHVPHDLLSQVIREGFEDAVRMYRMATPIDEVRLSPSQLAMVDMLAQQGRGAEVLNALLMVSYGVATEQIGEHARRIAGNDPHLVEALQASLRDGLAFIIRLSQLATTRYQAASEAWKENPGAHRARIAKAILAGSDPAHAATVFGRPQVAAYPFHLDQVAIVAWVDGPVEELAQHEVELGQLCSRVAGVVGATSTLTASVDAATMWAWFALPSAHHIEPDVHELDKLVKSGIHVAISDVSSGLAGFRAMMTEARRAHAMVVKAAPRRRPPVTSAVEVSEVALLAADLPALRSWVASILGELAFDAPELEELRETFHAYLRSGRSLARAGQVLHVHRNTVHKRVQLARDLCRRNVDDSSAPIETALHACQLLGEPVLATRSPKASPRPEGTPGFTRADAHLSERVADWVEAATDGGKPGPLS